MSTYNDILTDSSTVWLKIITDLMTVADDIAD